MNQRLAHRGPDDGGVLSEHGIALGHRRLSIIDLSAAGHQPMAYGGGRYTIVYNGELYNYLELRRELSDARFDTATDTEVVVAAYAKWGAACLDRFNGMFAFAIWDKCNRTLFVARDRLGVKPLYYATTTSPEGGRVLAFSSELRPLLASGLVPPRMNRVALTDYLYYQTVHAPETIVEGVSVLLPGHHMLLSDRLEIVRWWQPLVRSVEVKAYAQICENVLALLRSAVERRLVADVPFGAFLSGGIDSSAIVALMSQVATTKVKTFSVVFDDSELDEAVYARMVSRRYGTEHHELRLTPEEFLADLPAALDAMDHPSGDGPNTYVVSKATRAAGITMALSGLGGDELFAGYDIFKRAVSLDRKSWLNAFPRSLREAAGDVLRTVRPTMASEKTARILSERHVNFASFYPYSRQVLLEEQVRAVLAGQGFPCTSVGRMATSAEARVPDKQYVLSRVSIAEMETYMQNVLLRDTDQMSMAHALEVRVPFLDYTLVEYVLNLPDAVKYPLRPKSLLIDSLGDLLPSEIVNRPKMGFVLPWKDWMKRDLRGFCEQRLRILGEFSGFHAGGLVNVWNSFLRDDPKVTYSRVWPLVVLGHWIEKQGIDA